MLAFLGLLRVLPISLMASCEGGTGLPLIDYCFFADQGWGSHVPWKFCASPVCDQARSSKTNSIVTQQGT